MPMPMTPEELNKFLEEYFTLNVVFELTHPEARLPLRATELSGAYDAFACFADKPIEVYAPNSEAPSGRLPSSAGLVLYPRERAKIPLGFKFRLPPGWQANIAPRSGNAWNKGLTLANAIGLADADFPNEYMALVQNAGTLPIYILPGDKVVQLNFTRYGTIKLEAGKVVQTTSRSGGLGHTGR